MMLTFWRYDRLYLVEKKICREKYFVRIIELIEQISDVKLTK